MKFVKISTMGIGMALTGLFAFRTAVDNGSVKGTVSPAEGATRAWILSSTDTLKTFVKDGAYEIKNVKPGT
jgi:hypothetical protein